TRGRAARKPFPGTTKSRSFWHVRSAAIYPCRFRPGPNYLAGARPLNASLVPGLFGPTGVAVSGSNLFVANFAVYNEGTTWGVHNVRVAPECDLRDEWSGGHCRVRIGPVCRESRQRHGWGVYHVGYGRKCFADLGIE